MAEQDIIQNLISRLGQSQADRLPPELDRHFVDIEERTPETLLSQAAALAEYVRFYATTDVAAEGDWSAYFPADADQCQAVFAHDDGDVPPHLGLFATFLRLYRFPQQAINAVTGKHLDFQFQRVLGFGPRAAQPDHAHLLLDLKKGAAPVAITTRDLFSAGKDEQGVELIYQPVREVVINHGRVAELKSVYRGADRLRFAPIANSAQGLGGPLDPERPYWPAFGNDDLPEAQIGFALASPVLRMAEGARTIRVELQLLGLDPQRHTTEALAQAFVAHLSGPKGWVEAQTVSVQLAGNRMTLTVGVAATQPAIVDYDASIHGQTLAAQAPVLQLLINQAGSLRLQDLAGLILQKIRIQVEVESLTALDVENDFGKLNAKKSFQPFGSQPVVGSRFMIGCDEALSKRLRELSVKLTWQGAPPSLATWYANYNRASQMSSGVSAHLIYQEGSGQTTSTDVIILANAATATTTLRMAGPLPLVSPPDNKTDAKLFALSVADNSGLRERGQRLARARPLFLRRHVPAPTVRKGFITIALLEDFLHADYRTEIIANARLPVAEQKTRNEPYTPTVQAIQLS